MELYIKIENGTQVGYPFLLENLKQCGINPENSSDWAPHHLITDKPPIVKRSEALEIAMVFDGKISYEVWQVRKKTEEELAMMPSMDHLDKIPGSAPNVI